MTNNFENLPRFFSIFRKWKLSTYKKKKVRKEKTPKDRMYFVKFMVKINDPINPQESHKEYEMFIPAKAAFFAKRKTRQSIIKKLEIEFIDCDFVSEEEFEAFEETREQYIEDIKEGIIVKN
jgi:flagellar biosynthesis regulator FlbT